MSGGGGAHARTCIFDFPDVDACLKRRCLPSVFGWMCLPAMLGWVCLPAVIGMGVFAFCVRVGVFAPAMFGMGVFACYVRSGLVSLCVHVVLGVGIYMSG